MKQKIAAAQELYRYYLEIRRDHDNVPLITRTHDSLFPFYERRKETANVILFDIFRDLTEVVL